MLTDSKGEQYFTITKQLRIQQIKLNNFVKDDIFVSDFSNSTYLINRQEGEIYKLINTELTPLLLSKSEYNGYDQIAFCGAGICIIGRMKRFSTLIDFTNDQVSFYHTQQWYQEFEAEKLGKLLEYRLVGDDVVHVVPTNLLEKFMKFDVANYLVSINKYYQEGEDLYNL